MQPPWVLKQWWIATGSPHTERNYFPSGHFTARREGPFYTPAEPDLTHSFPSGPAAVIIDGISWSGVCWLRFVCHQLWPSLWIIQQCCPVGGRAVLLVHVFLISILGVLGDAFDVFCSMLIWINNTLEPIPRANTAFSVPYWSSRWSMNVCGTGCASPRHSWEWWLSNFSETRKSCWPEPCSPCRRRGKPTRRSWSATEATSTSRTSAHISERRLASCIPSHQGLSKCRNMSNFTRKPFLCMHVCCSSEHPSHLYYGQEVDEYLW